LVNFQTAVTSLTGMDIANASLLDEATAAAEAMVMCFAQYSQKKRTFLVDQFVTSSTLSVLRTRAKGFGIKLIVADLTQGLKVNGLNEDLCGVLIQYPNVNGNIINFSELATETHEHDALITVATDLLALSLLKPPGEWGADIVFGNSARFGVPAGYGGPHAAFFACKDSLKRKMPGRLIGLSRDAQGKPAYRLALQSKCVCHRVDKISDLAYQAREQHIRREKATSNICTSQALLANMAAMYAVYHGPTGITRIAERVHRYTSTLSKEIQSLGFRLTNDSYFDTVTIDVTPNLLDAAKIHKIASDARINFRQIDSSLVGITLDESVNTDDLVDIINVFRSAVSAKEIGEHDLHFDNTVAVPDSLKRTTKFLTHPVFNKHHSETELLRYIYHLQNKDLSLVHAMIPLGSCTMKLNSASSMAAVTWPEYSNVHPFAPLEQTKGYQEIIKVTNI
jgi:glycine dehydrogenase